MTNQNCGTEVNEFYCNPLDPNGGSQAGGLGQKIANIDLLTPEATLLVDVLKTPLTVLSTASTYRDDCEPVAANVLDSSVQMPCIEETLRGAGDGSMNTMINFVITTYQTISFIGIALGTSALTLAVILNLINPLGSMKMWWPW